MIPVIARRRGFRKLSMSPSIPKPSPFGRPFPPPVHAESQNPPSSSGSYLRTLPLLICRPPSRHAREPLTAKGYRSKAPHRSSSKPSLARDKRTNQVALREATFRLGSHLTYQFLRTLETQESPVELHSQRVPPEANCESTLEVAGCYHALV
jgi:hypothetical protein